MARPVARPRARATLVTLALVALLLPASAGAASAGAVAAVDPVDTIAPTAPADLHLVSRARSGSITLGWTAATDAVGVTEYRMYRDGRWQGTLTQAGVNLIGTVWYDKLGGRIKAAVRYDLYAFDAAGNRSVPATLVVSP